MTAFKRQRASKKERKKQREQAQKWNQVKKNALASLAKLGEIKSVLHHTATSAPQVTQPTKAGHAKRGGLSHSRKPPSNHQVNHAVNPQENEDSEAASLVEERLAARHSHLEKVWKRAQLRQQLHDETMKHRQLQATMKELSKRVHVEENPALHQHDNIRNSHNTPNDKSEKMQVELTMDPSFGQITESRASKIRRIQRALRAARSKLASEVAMTPKEQRGRVLRLGAKLKMKRQAVAFHKFRLKNNNRRIAALEKALKKNKNKAPHKKAQHKKAPHKKKAAP